MAFSPLCKGVQVRFSNFTVYSLCRGERTWLRDTCSESCYTVYKLVQNSSMDKVAMSMMGGQGLLQN